MYLWFKSHCLSGFLRLTKTLEELAATEIASITKMPSSVFKPGDQVSKVLGVMKSTGRDEAVAAEGDRIGIVTVRNLLGVDQPSRTKIERIWEQIEAVGPNTIVLDVSVILHMNRVKALPIVLRGKVIGIISQTDIINELTQVPGLSEIKAMDLISNQVETMETDIPVSRIRRTMLDKGINYIPITGKGKLKGIISASDIVHTYITPAIKTTRGDRSGGKVSRFRGQAGDIMDTHPFTVDLDASALDVVNGLARYGTSACILVDENDVVRGIITGNEFVELIQKLRGEPELPVYIMGITDEDFFERAIAEGKVRRMVNRSLKIHPDITEVRIRIKKQQTKGERTRYQMTARALSPRHSFNAENEGWGLMETFDGLCGVLDKTLRRAKKSRSKGPRRGRRRINPNLKP